MSSQETAGQTRLGDRAKYTTVFALGLLSLIAGLLLWQVIECNAAIRVQNSILEQQRDALNQVRVSQEVITRWGPPRHLDYSVPLLKMQDELALLRAAMPKPQQQKLKSNAPDQPVNKLFLVGRANGPPWEQGDDQPVWQFFPDGPAPGSMLFRAYTIPYKDRDGGIIGPRSLPIMNAAPATSVEGYWRLSEDGFTLILTDMLPNHQPALNPKGLFNTSFPVAIVGRMYLNIGEHQYFIGGRMLPDK